MNDFRETLTIKSNYQLSADNFYSRSAHLKKCCIDCAPNSSIYYNASNKNNYLINIFNAPSSYSLAKHRRVWKSLFPNLTYSIFLDIRQDLKPFRNLTIQNEKMSAFIEYNLSLICGQSQDAISFQVRSKFAKSIRAKILATYNHIDLNYGQVYYQKLTKFIMIAFKYLMEVFYSKILCCQVHMSAIEAADKKGLPIVYLSNSKVSLLDQLIIQLTLFFNGSRLPFIFTEKSKIDLTKGYFKRKILQLFGVKFFDQTLLEDAFKKYKHLTNYALDGSSLNDECLFHRQVIEVYLIECLKSNNSLTFNYDSYLTNCLIDLVEKEALYDFLIVPVDVSYEKPLNNSTGCMDMLKNLYFGPLFGQVRVNFSQPFSLKELLETSSAKNSFRFKRPFNKSTYLKRHVAHDMFQVKSIMCTNMVAFLLFTQFQHGCNINDLFTGFDELKQFLSLNHQLGFTSLSSRDSVFYALDLIRDYVIIKRKNENYFVRINSDENSVRHIFELSKIVTNCYFLNSITTLSIQSSFQSDIYHSRICNDKSNMQSVNENDLIIKSLKLMLLLRYEFNNVFKKPCESFYTKVFQSIHDLSNIELLVDKNLFRGNKNRYFQRNDDLAFDEDSENEEIDFTFKGKNQFIENDSDEADESDFEFDPDEDIFADWTPSKYPKSYQVPINKRNFGKLIYLSNILEPYIKAYIHVIKFIKTLEPTQKYSDTEFYQMLDSFNKTEHGDSFKPHKSILKCLQSNIVESFVDIKVLSRVSSKEETSRSIGIGKTQQINEIYLFLRSCMI